METHRILRIAEHPHSGENVIYVMSRDQRAHDNHALLAAQNKAAELGIPLVILFNFLAPTRSQNARAYEHVAFMVAGLKEVAKSLKALGIPFILTADDTDVTLKKTLEELKPAALYFDFSPFKSRRALIKSLAQDLQVSAYVVDTHNIIPAWVASDHQEFAAHTFRRKVHKHLETFLIAPEKVKAETSGNISLPKSLTFEEVDEYITAYPRRNIKIAFTPGEAAAHKRLADFIENGLETYATQRNNIAEDHQSNLSPYLHFGQISSLRVAVEVLKHTSVAPLLFNQPRMASAGELPSSEDGMNALFEEMIVRKELSDNFIFYAESFNSLASIPNWAVKTLEKHQNDLRETIYSIEALETSATHDVIWNSAQKELVLTGKLHGYLRMYWAKKILEWTPSADEAIRATIYLNDAYSIDGADPNGYVGILWAIAGLHDRPWNERPIFGMVRYMNEAGLRRKFDVKRYLEHVDSL